FLSLSWALALSVVLLTTPAVIYGGGTGHVETRTALFMLVGAFAVADGNRVGNPGAAIVAGLAAGFFLGSKYYGLFGATALGLVLIQRHSIRPFILFCLTAAVAGGQWYAWNAAHTGDPLFPTLYRLLGTSSAWNGDV